MGKVGQQGGIRFTHTVHDETHLLVRNSRSSHLLDGPADMNALPRRVGYEDQMGDRFHHTPVDLFDTGLAVDDDDIKISRQAADNLFQQIVDLAVAAFRFRAPDGQKRQVAVLR